MVFVKHPIRLERCKEDSHIAFTKVAHAHTVVCEKNFEIVCKTCPPQLIRTSHPTSTSIALLMLRMLLQGFAELAYHVFSHCGSSKRSKRAMQPCVTRQGVSLCGLLETEELPELPYLKNFLRQQGADWALEGSHGQLEGCFGVWGAAVSQSLVACTHGVTMLRGRHSKKCSSPSLSPSWCSLIELHCCCIIKPD
eukprot:4607824-Amphidinium_carterae.1